jgi:hypothetical protein
LISLTTVRPSQYLLTLLRCSREIWLTTVSPIPCSSLSLLLQILHLLVLLSPILSYSNPVSFRATSSPARSSNSLVCKFSYVPPDAAANSPGWNADGFLEKIGLGELVERGLGALGGKTGEVLGNGEGSLQGEGKEGLVMTAGLPVGKGLSKKAAEELGLVEGTAVGSAVIDACEYRLLLFIRILFSLLA